MKNIKIAIDISPTQNTNSKRGVGYYTSRLVSAIKSEISSNPNFHLFSLFQIDDPNSDKNRFDLIHYPYFDPFTLSLPPKQKIPIIVTVHDLIPRQLKTLYPVGLRGELKWLVQLNRLRQVDRIITDSQTSKFQICHITGISARKITTIYLAADSIFKPINNLSLFKNIIDKYSLPSKFILYVGDINRNKNIPLLVSTCQKLNYPLVIVGSSATQSNIPIHPWNYDITWLQQQKWSDLHLLGFVPDDELALIYNLATLYCQPSIAEGFGLPLLEAMQSGCPTVYSQNTSLEEISIGSGLKFDPTSSQDLSKNLTSLWTSSKLRQKYHQAGIAQAKLFSWKYTAIQTLETYRLCLT